MKRHSKNYRVSATFVLGLMLLALTSCAQYAVPITEQPTRKIDAMLIGDWVSPDRRVRIRIRELNETTYIVSYNSILFQAFHSDIAGSSFLSVQELETSHRTFSYLAYRSSEQGSKLHVRLVDKNVIPEEINDSATVQRLLRKNLQNPALFHGEAVFTREHSSPWSSAE